MNKLLLSVGLLLSLVGTAAAEIYKWVDENGRVHFGDAPPAGQDRESIDTPPAPDAEDVQRSRETLERLLRQQKRRADKRARQAQAQREEKESSKYASEIRVQHCWAAQQALVNLHWPGAVYAVDDKGNRQLVGNKDRTEEIERAKKQIEQYCD